MAKARAAGRPGKPVTPAKAVKPAPAAKASPAAKAVPAAKPAKPAARPPVAAPAEPGEPGWLDTGTGYALALIDGKLAARNDKGKRLTAVPKELRDGDVADQLEALRDWLADHQRDCLATVDQWMLRSLPVPRAVLERVWADPAWRTPLENAVVVAVAADGSRDDARAGLFRGVHASKGVGVVDLDGETAWLDTDRVALPHPILIAELDAWRELITQIGATQGISQLHRETHGKPTDAAAGAQAIDDYEDGKFAMLMHAIGKARTLGYKVRGGFAVCRAWDAGAITEARYWIGAESPESETLTGQLQWVDDRERVLPIAQVGPVAFSEGMRMASAIYAARVVDKTEVAA